MTQKQLLAGKDPLFWTQHYFNTVVAPFHNKQLPWQPLSSLSLSLQEQTVFKQTLKSVSKVKFTNNWITTCNYHRFVLLLLPSKYRKLDTRHTQHTPCCMGDKCTYYMKLSKTWDMMWNYLGHSKKIHCSHFLPAACKFSTRWINSLFHYLPNNRLAVAHRHYF